MAQRAREQRVQNVERRLTSIEQILPTLATKADLLAAKNDLEAALATKAELQAAIAPLATKAEVQAAIAPLATRAEVQAAIAPLATKAEVQGLEAAMARLETTVAVTAEETRRHFDVVAESLHGDIRLIVEGLLAAEARSDARHDATNATLTQHDRRLTRLEASAPRRR